MEKYLLVVLIYISVISGEALLFFLLIVGHLGFFFCVLEVYRLRSHFVVGDLFSNLQITKCSLYILDAFFFILSWSISCL